MSDLPIITEKEVDLAWRVLHNWGGLRYRGLDEKAIVKTMLLAALQVRASEIENVLVSKRSENNE